MTDNAIKDEAVSDELDDDDIVFVGHTNEELHALGDRMHGQVTAFNAEEPRYSWAIDPQDAAVLLCLDDETGDIIIEEINAATEPAAELIGEAMEMVARMTA